MAGWDEDGPIETGTAPEISDEARRLVGLLYAFPPTFEEACSCKRKAEPCFRHQIEAALREAEERGRREGLMEAAEIARANRKIKSSGDEIAAWLRALADEPRKEGE